MKHVCCCIWRLLVQSQVQVHMVNGIRTILPRGLNKKFGLKFCMGSRVQHETPEERGRMYHSKHCEYNHKDDDNSPNTLSDKNYQAPSQKFRQIMDVFEQTGVWVWVCWVLWHINHVGYLMANPLYIYTSNIYGLV